MPLASPAINGDGVTRTLAMGPLGLILFWAVRGGAFVWVWREWVTMPLVGATFLYPGKACKAHV